MTGMEEIKRNIVGILFEINRQYRITPVQFMDMDWDEIAQLEYREMEAPCKDSGIELYQVSYDSFTDFKTYDSLTIDMAHTAIMNGVKEAYSIAMSRNASIMNNTGTAAIDIVEFVNEVTDKAEERIAEYDPLSKKDLLKDTERAEMIGILVDVGMLYGLDPEDFIGEAFDSYGLTGNETMPEDPNMDEDSGYAFDTYTGEVTYGPKTCLQELSEELRQIIERKSVLDVEKLGINFQRLKDRDLMEQAAENKIKEDVITAARTRIKLMKDAGIVYEKPEEID